MWLFYFQLIIIYKNFKKNIHMQMAETSGGNNLELIFILALGLLSWEYMRFNLHFFLGAHIWHVFTCLVALSRKSALMYSLPIFHGSLELMTSQGLLELLPKYDVCAVFTSFFLLGDRYLFCSFCHNKLLLLCDLLMLIFTP